MTLSKLALRVVQLSVSVFSITTVSITTLIIIAHSMMELNIKTVITMTVKTVKICVRVEQIMMNVVRLSVLAPGLEHRFE